jgi:hypothetical protein
MFHTFQPSLNQYVLYDPEDSRWQYWCYIQVAASINLEIVEAGWLLYG